jgi:hypothetical protein
MANTDERLKEIASIENRYDGWWCPRCNRSVPPIEATYEERHDGCGEELVGLDENGVDSIFAAQKALEARDLLRQAAKCVKGICALTGADVSKIPLIQKINEVLEN